MVVAAPKGTTWTFVGTTPRLVSAVAVETNLRMQVGPVAARTLLKFCHAPWVVEVTLPIKLPHQYTSMVL